MWHSQKEHTVWNGHLLIVSDFHCSQFGWYCCQMNNWFKMHRFFFSFLSIVSLCVHANAHNCVFLTLALFECARAYAKWYLGCWQTQSNIWSVLQTSWSKRYWYNWSSCRCQILEKVWPEWCCFESSKYTHLSEIWSLIEIRLILYSEFLDPENIIPFKKIDWINEKHGFL